uniref:Uncharacterized protein n=1 Tax=Aegilops tauschii subsp. strangulata TaxID=200361 RepID=A0A453IU63_AEGTS
MNDCSWFRICNRSLLPGVPSVPSVHCNHLIYITIALIALLYVAVLIYSDRMVVLQFLVCGIIKG